MPLPPPPAAPGRPESDAGAGVARKVPARPGQGDAFLVAALAPLTPLPWVFFLVWTAVGAAVMPLRLGEETVRTLLADRHAGLAEAINTLLRASDAVWIVLAAAVVYLATAAAEGLPTARRWAAILLGGSAAAEWLGAQTGFPFGPYVYTDRFGWRLGGVLPFTIPLAWMVVALGGRYLTLWLKPEASRVQVALGAALAGLLTDANLEPIAWKERGYWLWYPDQVAHLPAFPPAQNYVSWFVLMFLLSLLLPPNHALRPDRARLAARRPVLVLGLMNGLFLLVHAARWARVHWPSAA